MVKYYNSIFILDMARVEELPFLCTQISFVHHVIATNNQPPAVQHVREEALRGMVNLDNIADAAPEFVEKRANFTTQLKQFYDQIDFSIAMYDIFKGLVRFSQVC